MATIDGLGNVRARCPGCLGATSTFEWQSAKSEYGNIQADRPGSHGTHLVYVLMRCAGCGAGGFATVAVAGRYYADAHRRLEAFHPEVAQRLDLPAAVPKGIAAEFREAESCLDSRCYRAAAGMFRSVLDKTLRASGYKLKPGTNLEQQIDMAADDGAITQARKRKAHDDIRVLGNDVLHDEWQAIVADDVEPAHHYTQRILEDFYDDRESVLKLLRTAGRVPDEDRKPPGGK